MFCPQCHAEYRPGFTRCADCDVDLVYELPKAALVAPEPPSALGDSDDDPFVSFWKGEDPRVHAELCQLLSDHDIPHRTIRRQDHLFRISSRTAFEIGIPFSRFEQAESVIREAYGSSQEVEPPSNVFPVDPDDLPGSHYGRPRQHRQLPQSNLATPSWSQAVTQTPEEKTSASARSSRWNPDHWFSEDATVEVWKGESPEMAELLAASLNENQIRSRLAASGDQQALLVMPADEVRAGEIIREVVEGIPPE